MPSESSTVRISITVEGAAEEIPDALRTLLLGLRRWGSLEEADAQPPSPAATQSVDWAPEKLTCLWGGIAEGAREALAEIASRPNGYPKEDLYETLSLDGRTVGGRLSSVGAAMARLGFWNKMTRTGMEWPWSFDGVQYQMKPKVAEMILQLRAQELSRGSE